MPAPQAFIDMDGVLADFDRHHERCFGIPIDRNTVDPPDFWDRIRDHGTFYRDLPLMPDALDLWRGVQMLHPRPIILSGIPNSIPDAADQKRAWIAEHIGPNIPAIFCASKDKRKHGSSGDVLVDDWNKYQPLWEDMGGIFILHTSAESSLKALTRFFLSVRDWWCSGCDAANNPARSRCWRCETVKPVVAP